MDAVGLLLAWHWVGPFCPLRIRNREHRQDQELAGKFKIIPEEPCAGLPGAGKDQPPRQGAGRRHS